jgi:thiamine-monophosphate kinase
MAALTEFDLIDRYFRRPSPSAILGVGDDAAIVAPAAGCDLAVSVDMLVEGRHFPAGVDPRSLGHKALAVNLSDMAAMGATPRWALLAGALPEANPAWIEAFAGGFFALADEYRVELIGGDTTRGPLNLSVTILGEVPHAKALCRSGARTGDSIWVSGRLGDAALALAHQQGTIELSAEELASCLRALMWPQPRVRLGLRLRQLASAAIDISDGLVGDLAHILQSSAVGAEIALASLPRSQAARRLLAGDGRAAALQCMLAGGDDYELCFTSAAVHDRSVAAVALELGVAVCRVGTIVDGDALVVRDENGAQVALPRGFDHFA